MFQELPDTRLLGNGEALHKLLLDTLVWVFRGWVNYNILHFHGVAVVELGHHA
jgi:hypothetical protein